MQSILRCLVAFAFLLCTTYSACAAPASGAPAARTTGTPTAQKPIVSQQQYKLEKVRGTITGNPGGKGPAQWFDGKCENIHIELIDGNAAVTDVVHAVPDGNGCRFEAIASAPRALRIQAPATYGKNEFKWQYYQQWTSSDTNNTTNIVLKDAGPKTVQMAVTMPDIKIKSVKTYPLHPTDREFLDIVALVENKGGLPGKKKLYYRCIPHDTPTCGGMQNSNNLLSTDVDVAAGSVAEKKLFDGGGANLWMLKPGKYEIVAGFSQSLADDTVLRRKFTVDATPLTVYKTWPSTIAAGENSYSEIQVSGAKFTTQSTILMKRPGAADRIPLSTYVPTGTNQTKPNALAGKLPAGTTIGNQPGEFYFWVKNPDGEMSNEATLTVKPAYTGPPMVKDYYPLAIKQWNFDPYNNKVSMPIGFLGEDLRSKQLKMTAAIVESSGNSGTLGQLTLSPDSPSTAHLTMPGYAYLKKGVIEIAIYNGDPSNSYKVRIPVDMDMPVLEPPVIVSPMEGEIFFSRDITLRIEPPAGNSSKKYRLHWWFQPLHDTGSNFDQIFIMPDVDLSGAGTQGIKIPQSLFPGEGSYRVDARVAETGGATSLNGTTKWINFKVIRH